MPTMTVLKNREKKGSTPISTRLKQELQEVLKFPIEIFWNLEAILKSELLYF